MKIKELISSFCVNEKSKKVIIIAGLIGIALIFLSGFFKSEPKKEKIKIEDINTQEYRIEIEKSLNEIVCSIKGAGKSKVLVTLENGTKNVYATEQKTNKEALEDKSNGETTKKKESDDSEVKYIKVKDSNGTEQALSVTQIQPTVKGVVIVCDGGDDPAVQERIVNAVTTALNITSKRVCVTR